MGQRWQLLDRPVEQEAIRSALANGESGGVVLVGAAGVGKTTLARTVTASLVSKVHWAACTESSRSIPLAVFAQWVRLRESRDPIALIASARESILAQKDTVVGIDDAHLLDQLSAALLHQIAVDHAGHIVVTVRSGEPVPEAVTALWKDGYLQRLELQPFTKQQSIAVVEAVLGGTLEGLSADVMWGSSGGNPLFLRHMVEGAIDAGLLTDVNGVWQLREPTVVPSSLAALLENRLDRAGNDVVNALKLLALCEPLDIDTLSDLAGEEAVDAAAAHGLIRVVHEGAEVNVRFSHPLFGDVVQYCIGTASARKLRGRIARALRGRELNSAASRIRMAQLGVDSDAGVDTELLIAAAEDAIYLSNLPLGERIARAAFERGGGVREAELLSRALMWQGQPVQADEILSRFEPNDLDDVQLVQWGISRVTLSWWSMGDAARANQVLALLLQRLQHPSLKLAVEAVGSLMAVHENRIAEGIAEAQRVLADPRTPEQAIDFAALSAGLAMPVAGHGADFEPIAARCRADQKATDGMVRVMVRYCDVLALTFIGELDLADQRAAEYAEFSSAGQRWAWAFAKSMAGLVAICRGKFPEAISALEQAVAAQAAEVRMPWQLPAGLLLAKAYAALGRADEAEWVLADADEQTGQIMALYSPELMIARSWLAAGKGMERRGIELALAAADLAHGSGQYAVEAEALHHAARFGDRTVTSRLAELTEHVGGRVVAMYARHAAAVAASDAAGLDAVSAEFEHAGFILSAADSTAQAAPLHDHAGQRHQSAESAARALRLAAQCGGATTPAIRSAARPLPVTSREREIATLIAEGLSNREIAERLTLSIRTIEGHIYRAFIKLGVSERDELAQIVARM